MKNDEELEREPKRRRLSLSHDAAPKKLLSESSDTEKEVKCGITSFIDNSSLGFSGILKQRYTDFLVNEILPNGEVLHLQRLGVPKHNHKMPPTGGAENVDQSDQAASKSEAIATAGILENEINMAGHTNSQHQVSTVAKESMEISPADHEELHHIFGESISEKISALYDQILKHPNRKPRDFTPVTSNVIPDKELRTKAHQLIRKVFASGLDTKTSAEDTIIITRAPNNVQHRGGHANGMPRVKNKLGWDELGGEYLHFTLYKENKDTMEVIYFLASQLKVNVKSFQFSGTKDRRAVTVQRASAYRIRAEQLASIGRKLRVGSKVGDFQYHSSGLELGDLGGNEFQITLRDCQFPGDQSSIEDQIASGESILSKRMETFKTKGFINYYGLQRFGSFSTGTHTVGTKLLKGDLKGAIDAILYFTPEALMAAQNPAPEGLLMSSDDKARAEAIHIWNSTKNSNKALEKLPKKFSAEINLIRALGFKDRRTGEMTRLTDHQGALMTIPRNLRLMYVHAYQSLVWNHAAGIRWELYGSRVVAGDLIIIPKASSVSQMNQQPEYDEQGEPIFLPSLEQTSDGAPPASEDIYERARSLTAEEASGGKYTVHDIVLPLPGFDVNYPGNEVGQFYKEFMASEKGGGLDPYDMRRAWKDISLSGGYRKLMAKPENVSWELKKYKYPEDQLVQTDLDVLNERNQSGPKGMNSLNSATGDVREGQEVENRNDKEEADKIALLLRMRLGSSTYATMALRELMNQGGLVAYKPEYGGGR